MLSAVPCLEKQCCCMAAARERCINVHLMPMFGTPGDEWLSLSAITTPLPDGHSTGPGALTPHHDIDAAALAPDHELAAPGAFGYGEAPPASISGVAPAPPGSPARKPRMQVTLARTRTRTPTRPHTHAHTPTHTHTHTHTHHLHQHGLSHVSCCVHDDAWCERALHITFPATYVLRDRKHHKIVSHDAVSSTPQPKPVTYAHGPRATAHHQPSTHQPAATIVRHVQQKPRPPPLALNTHSKPSTYFVCGATQTTLHTVRHPQQCHEPNAPRPFWQGWCHQTKAPAAPRLCALGWRRQRDELCARRVVVGGHANGHAGCHEAHLFDTNGTPTVVIQRDTANHNTTKYKSNKRPHTHTHQRHGTTTANTTHPTPTHKRQVPDDSRSKLLHGRR